MQELRFPRIEFIEVMALANKNPDPIECVAYCHVGDQLVSMEDLTPEQKEKAAKWLIKTYLDELYRGVAAFHFMDEAQHTDAPGQPGA